MWTERIPNYEFYQFIPVYAYRNLWLFVFTLGPDNIRGAQVQKKKKKNYQ